MAFTSAGKEAMLDELGLLITKMRLLDGNDDEIVDHDDASQDQAVVWDSASGSSMALDGSCAFEVKSGITVTSISFRSTDGLTEYARDVLAVGDQETYAGDGTYTVTNATLEITDPA